MAVSADTFRDCAIYDSEMESKLEDMKARLASAEVRETSMRELVGKAQMAASSESTMVMDLRAATLIFIASPKASSEVNEFARSRSSASSGARAEVPAHIYTLRSDVVVAS